MKEKLIELIQSAYDGRVKMSAARLADYLIANGVTVPVKKEKPPVDLTDKCGSCFYATAEGKKLFPNTRSYVWCINPDKKWVREIQAYRARTTKCCKMYKPKENSDA